MKRTSFFAILLMLTLSHVYSQVDTANLPYLEETPGVYKLGDAEVRGAIAGDRFTVNDSFLQQFDLGDIPAYFSIIAPRHDERAVTGGGGQLLTVAYQQEGQAVEIIRFTTLTVPGASVDLRIQTLADFFINNGASIAFRGWEQSSFEGIYRTHVGDYEAVVIQGWAQSKAEGQYWVRMYGILKPGGQDAILALVLIDPELSGISPDELPNRGINLSVVHSLEFID